MRKNIEMSNPDSCLSKAKHTEMLFVMLGRDVAAPDTIRFWIAERIRLGKNHFNDPQLVEALACAQAMEADRAEKEYDHAQG